MKTAITVLTIGAGAIGGLLATANRNDEGLDSRIMVDPTPPLRSGALGGYADVVDAVAPSVVGIFTTRAAPASVQGGQLPGQLFESPMFREFFGPGFGGRRGGGIPRQMPPQQGLGALDDETRRRLDLGAKVEGAVVLSVEPGSDAAAAGLRPGSVITEVNRNAVNGPSDAYAKAAERKDRATLLRVTDGKLPRYMAIG